MIERLETAESPPERSACRAGRSQIAVTTNALTVTDFEAFRGRFTKGPLRRIPNLTHPPGFEPKVVTDNIKNRANHVVGDHFPE
jgi:hypothetical protein